MEEGYAVSSVAWQSRSRSPTMPREAAAASLTGPAAVGMLASMHCSLWRFEGDPDDLERRYLDLLAEIPESNHRLHAAAKAPTGLLIFDTCPSEKVYRDFFEGRGLELFAKHGLVPASREDYPVTRAYAQGTRVDTA